MIPLSPRHTLQNHLIAFYDELERIKKRLLSSFPNACAEDRRRDAQNEESLHNHHEIQRALLEPDLTDFLSQLKPYRSQLRLCLRKLRQAEISVNKSMTENIQALESELPDLINYLRSNVDPDVQDRILRMLEHFRGVLLKFKAFEESDPNAGMFADILAKNLVGRLFQGIRDLNIPLPSISDLDSLQKMPEVDPKDFETLSALMVSSQRFFTPTSEVSRLLANTLRDLQTAFELMVSQAANVVMTAFPDINPGSKVKRNSDPLEEWIKFFELYKIDLRSDLPALSNYYDFRTRRNLWTHGHGQVDAIAQKELTDRTTHRFDVGDLAVVTPRDLQKAFRLFSEMAFAIFLAVHRQLPSSPFDLRDATQPVSNEVERLCERWRNVTVDAEDDQIVVA
jgi:hypothetical protein